MTKFRCVSPCSMRLPDGTVMMQLSVDDIVTMDDSNHSEVMRLIQAQCLVPLRTTPMATATVSAPEMQIIRRGKRGKPDK